MDLDIIVRQIAETIQKEANVRAVFGEPIKLETRTVIPIATIRINFGGGVGSAHPTTQVGEGTKGFIGAGGGGGLEVHADPIGFLSERDGQVIFQALTAQSVDGSMIQRLLHRIETR